MSGFRAWILRLIQNCSVRTTVLIPAVVYCLAVLCFIRDKHSLFGFSSDDAWIARVFPVVSPGAGIRIQ